jgi:transcriptional regulator with XRE-family HTH domain
LAKRAQVSTSTVRNIENGRHAPALATLEALATVLSLPDLVLRSPLTALLEATTSAALADLLRRYSVAVLVEALRLAHVDLWGLFAALCPASAALAQSVARVNVGALAAEQGVQRP